MRPEDCTEASARAAAERLVDDEVLRRSAQEQRAVIESMPTAKQVASMLTDRYVLRFRRTVPEERPDMPFFIDWQGANEEMDPQYAVGPVAGIAWIEYGGDATQLQDWVGDADVPIRAASGRPGPRRFALMRTTGSEIVVE
ncbi:MAG TPA: hypothetical protein VFU14_03775 [Acidimicrobiales bacterium]|nr:hypothetical protein [Acidimicrobiales bacterium]